MARPFDRILTLDMETRWSRKPTEWCTTPYTLSRLTTEEYIRSPLFKAFGACIHEFGSDTPIQWYSYAELGKILHMWDWSKTAVLCHNTQFDASILSMIYGVRPVFLFDTLSMARALRGMYGGNSLAELAKAFNLPPKGEAVYSTEGLLELTPEIEKELAEYCKHDVFLCERIFELLMQRTDAKTGIAAGPYPVKELKLIDITTRMYTDAKFVLDESMLENALIEEQAKLASALERGGIDQAELASNDQFAEVLRRLGQEPPTKVSKTTGKEAFAFAKNDALFQALINGDNEDVALICEARLKVKSTLERTRAQRFIDISRRGALPVPLSYYGAVTGRWSACVVAETEVTVYDRHNGQCTKRIVDVLPDDLVWDGVEFVQHEGVQFSGYKEVMAYDGITGTPDHKVFIDDDTTLTLAAAAECGARIMDAAEPDSGAVDAARARHKRLGW